MLASGDPEGGVPGGILVLMIGYGMRLSAVGIVVGLLAALILTRAMTTTLVGIKPADPVTFVPMPALSFLISAAATWIPARRTASRDASTALREQ